MPRKCVCVALVAIFALAASRSAHPQVTVDVTKVNCDQFVHHKISEPRLIAAWLSGYYNVKRNNRVIDLQTLEVAPRERWGENGPPKGKGGQGSELDKG
jgi:HdeA/HdeB family